MPYGMMQWLCFWSWMRIRRRRATGLQCHFFERLGPDFSRRLAACHWAHRTAFGKRTILELVHVGRIDGPVAAFATRIHAAQIGFGYLFKALVEREVVSDGILKHKRYKPSFPKPCTFHEI